MEASRLTDARVLWSVYGARKIYERWWDDAVERRRDGLWDGTERDSIEQQELLWIPSGKPWTTHRIDAVRVPHFTGGDTFALVFHLRRKWLAEDPRETFFWNFADCTEEHGWRADIWHGHHDGDYPVQSATADTLSLAIVRAALSFYEIAEARDA